MSSTLNSNCCSSVQSKSDCPLCQSPKQAVKLITLKHWLAASFVPSTGKGPFYFCDTKDCNVVYFSGDHSIQFTTDQIRDRVANK
ncbi:MAG: hypothetical protein ACE5EK_01810 [Nitrospinales bacterium]